MKIGILSDVHANVYALKTVLEQLKREGIEIILHAGEKDPETPVSGVSPARRLDRRRNIESIESDAVLRVAKYRKSRGARYR